MTPDFGYAADVIKWLMVWSAAGLVARQMLAQAEYRRRHR